MLMSVKCSAVVSVGVTLAYDDNFTKNEVISVGDFIYVEFNKNKNYEEDMVNKTN